MSWHGYIYIENLAMNANQKGQLIDALRALGHQTHSRPNFITQYRARLDNEAAIIEAVFADDDLTLPRLKQYLANIFGIDPALILHDVRQVKYGTAVTLSYLLTAYLRIGVFGGSGSDYETSRQAAVSYLIDFKDLWEEPEELPRGTVRIFGRPVKLYDPTFAPTAAVLRLVDRVRGRNA